MKNTKKITVSLFAVLSLAFVATASAFGQTAKSQQSASPEKITQRQINQLIATAKTPEDHQRIAEYYQEQAQQYALESQADAKKIEAYKRSPYLNSCMMCVSSSYSLEAAVRSLRLSKQIAEDRAAKLQELAAQQEQMSSFAMNPAMGMGQ
jgi:hypothetical protein